MSTEITVKNYRSSRKFGFGYTFTPTGEDAYSIETSSAPDHTGTLGQIHAAKEADRTFQSETAFRNTAWFYDGKRITHTWQFTRLHRAPDLYFDPENEDYSDYLMRDSENHAQNDKWGHDWVAGWHGTDGNNVKIRVTC